MRKKQGKMVNIVKLMEKIGLVVVLVSLFFVIESYTQRSTALATTTNRMDRSIVNDQKNSVPVPATFFLMLGGITSVVARYMHKGFESVKRCMDVLLGLAGLTFAAPILAFTSILIKLDSPGPIVYKQRRLGKNGKMFTIYKLRTMRNDAEKGTGAVWAQKNDPRITAVGRILRKTRLDEIPQLVNVIQGDMSLVGPRPERPELVQKLKDVISGYEKRLSVKPGLTGLAQVEHKYDESIEDVRTKVSYDLEYIKSMNLRTDLRIMAKTFGVVFTGKGAN